MMIDTVREYLEADDWKITQVGADTAYSMTVQGKNGRWPCVIQTDEDDGLLIFWSALPVRVAPDVRERVALMLSHINYGLVFGNFELNMDDGDLRFRTSLRNWKSEVSAMDVAIVVQSNVQAVDLYIKAIKDVAEEGSAIDIALALVDDFDD